MTVQTILRFTLLPAVLFAGVVFPGTAVAQVYDTEVAQVRLPLTDRQVALLDLPLTYDDDQAGQRSGAPVALQARFANRLWEWEGRIVRTDASIDVETAKLLWPRYQGTSPFPYCRKRYFTMSADSYIETPVFGSTKKGNWYRPPLAFTSSRNREPPFGQGYTIGSRLRADSASRAMRQYGQTSNS